MTVPAAIDALTRVSFDRRWRGMLDAMSDTGATATITMELPIEVFSALRRSPEQFAVEMRLAAAIHWYSRREVSMERAALVAGLNRRDFMIELGRRKIEIFQTNADELRHELAGG